MKTDTSEKGLEALIATYLCDTIAGNSFQLRHHAQYNRVECVDEELFFLDF